MTNKGWTGWSWLFSSCLYETMTCSYMEGGWLLRKRSCGRRTQTTQKCKHINRAKNKVTSQYQKVIDISLIKASHFGVHRPFTYRTLLFKDLPSCLMILWCFLRKRSHIGSNKCLHSMWDNDHGSVFRSFNYPPLLLFVGKLCKRGFLKIICCDNWNTYLGMVKTAITDQKARMNVWIIMIMCKLAN